MTLTSATGFFSLWLNGQVDKTQKEVFRPHHWHLHLHGCGCDIPPEDKTTPNQTRSKTCIGFQTFSPYGHTVPVQIWLPIRNQKTSRKEDKKMQFDFTVCISNLFEFNNTLQYAQTLEMYRSALYTTSREYSVDTIAATPPQSMGQSFWTALHRTGDAVIILTQGGVAVVTMVYASGIYKGIYSCIQGWR